MYSVVDLGTDATVGFDKAMTAAQHFLRMRREIYGERCGINGTRCGGKRWKSRTQKLIKRAW